MFNFFKRKKEFGTGLIDDPRPEAEKARDFEAEEILKAKAVLWKEKKPEEWRKFPIFDQVNSSSCVAQTVAKLLGVENYLEENLFVLYSAGDIYSQRSNYPAEGMWLKEGMEIGYKKGAVLEQLMPSQKKTEAELNAYRGKRTNLMNEIALPGKGGNYLALPHDFDAIAQVIREGKAVNVGFRFNGTEWRSGEVSSTPGGQYGHAVAVVDFCLWKGKKALVFDNTWGYGWGFNGQGVITEDKAGGMMGAWYYQDLKNTWRADEKEVPKPKYTFKIDLVFGMRNWDVGMLQECLQYEELFPVNVPSTGYYGNITTNAVRGFVEKYFPEKAGLYDGKRVDALIRGKLNEIFA